MLSVDPSVGKKYKQSIIINWQKSDPIIEDVTFTAIYLVIYA